MPSLSYDVVCGDKTICRAAPRLAPRAGEKLLLAGGEVVDITEVIHPANGGRVRLVVSECGGAGCDEGGDCCQEETEAKTEEAPSPRKKRGRKPAAETGSPSTSPDGSPEPKETGSES